MIVVEGEARMRVRQFVYGLLLEQPPILVTWEPVCMLVERLQARIDAMGVWGNAAGLSFVTGLPVGIVEDIITKGSKYCHD